ncbi:MAG: SDR family NAD(P)-dependent oxidoreductase [Burkholderiales bacterium]
MASLAGKFALVTGAARGIGAAIAVAFAKSGASVYLAASEPEEQLQKSVQACEKANPGGQYACGVFDFTEEGAAARMVDAALKRFGRIDVLVNNAGMRISKPYGEYSATDFDQVVAVNLKAPFLTSQAVIPGMKANGGGRIIHIASQMGLVTHMQIALYGLTKAALIHLTKSMAYELASHNILVNAVSPGPVMTEFNEARTNADPARKASRLAYIPAGRYGRSEEIADAVVFLATTDSTFIQGHNLVVDGGYVTH